MTACVVRWRVRRDFAINIGCFALFQVAKDRGAYRIIEQRFESRDRGGYDANVDFKAVAS